MTESGGVTPFMLALERSWYHHTCKGALASFSRAPIRRILESSRMGGMV